MSKKRPHKYDEQTKWFRGASRWNNGATRFGRKYQFSVLMGQLKIYPLKDFEKKTLI